MLGIGAMLRGGVVLGGGTAGVQADRGGGGGTCLAGGRLDQGSDHEAVARAVLQAGEHCAVRSKADRVLLLFGAVQFGDDEISGHAGPAHRRRPAHLDAAGLRRDLNVSGSV